MNNIFGNRRRLRIHKYFSFTKLAVLLSFHDLRAALQHRSCFFNSENIILKERLGQWFLHGVFQGWCLYYHKVDLKYSPFTKMFLPKSDDGALSLPRHHLLAVGLVIPIWSRYNHCHRDNHIPKFTVCTLILNLLMVWPIVIEDTVRPVATFQFVSEGGHQPDRAVKPKYINWNSVKCWKCSNHGYLSKGCLTMRRPRNPSTFVKSLKNRLWRKTNTRHKYKYKYNVTRAEIAWA